MSIEVAKTCMADPRPAVRQMGVGILAKAESPDAERALLAAMADGDRSVWAAACMALKERHPWLALIPTPPRTVPAGALNTSWGIEWSRLRGAIRGLIAQDPAAVPHMRWTEVPGLTFDVAEELRAVGHAGSADDLERSASGEPRQLILSPTYRCNITCSYCYARGFAGRFPPDLSLDDLDRLLCWAVEHGIDSILLGGGEPSIYAHLPELLAAAKAKAIRVSLTSNCLYSPTVRALVRPGSVHSLGAHYDQERLDGNGEATCIFTQNIKAARAAGIDVFFRFTITPQTTRDTWRNMMRQARDLSITRLNYAFAFEGAYRLNQHVGNQATVDAPGGWLERALLQFMDDAQEHGLRPWLCKPLPLCALSEPSLRRLIKEGAIRSACAAPLGGCARNLTVNPDLTTFPCNGLPIDGPRIDQFGSMEEAGRHYRPVIHRLLEHPYHQACVDCLFWYRGFCQGACLAEHYNMIRERQ